MAFQPDGDLVLIGSRAGARLWYSRTGLPASPMITSASYPSTLAFHREGRFFAIGYEDGTIRLYDVASAKPIGALRNLRNKVLGLTFSVDGRSLIALDVCGDVRTWVLPEPASGSPELLGEAPASAKRSGARRRPRDCLSQPDRLAASPRRAGSAGRADAEADGSRRARGGRP